MDRILRFAAAAAFGLAFAAPAAMADSHGGITVGGWIEVIGGTADNDKAGSVDGIDRGFFSRFSVSYDDTLDNGLTVAGSIAYHLNQRDSGASIPGGSAGPAQAMRMHAGARGAPDVLYISVGGGFGTVTVGAAAPASCSTLPRPIAFLNGVDQTHYTAFTGLVPLTEYGTFSEFGYCETPEQVSYTTPTVGGFKAMLSYMPDQESDQSTSLKNSVRTADTPRGTSALDTIGSGAGNIKDRMDIAANWETSMGAMSVALGAGYQQGRYQDGRGDMSSTAIAGTVGFGAVTLGASWFDTEKGDMREEDGYTLAAKYDIGNLTLASTWSTAELGDGTQEDSALVLGASYALGGGLTTWVEYMDLETDCTPNCQRYTGPSASATSEEIPESDDIILVGVTLGF